MRQILKKLNVLLDKKQKRTMVGLMFLMVIGAFLQTAGVGLLVQVVNIVIDPDALQNNAIAAWVYELCGSPDYETFAVSIMALLIAVFLLVTGQKIPFANIKKEVPLLLASGVAMGINWILLFEAYKYTTISVATLSYYFAPVIVIVVCPILFREKLTGRRWGIRR